MRFANALAKFCAAATILSSTVSALPKVTRAGRYLYSEDGTRFYIKGVAYQEQGKPSLQLLPATQALTYRFFHAS
jgi:hypothetical protein